MTTLSFTIASPPAALANGTGTINIAPCLNLRADATPQSALLGCIPQGTTITIDCVKTGTSVTGPYGATTLWDHTTYGGSSGFVADAFVYTGTANPVAPACGGGGGGGGGSPGSGTTKASPCLNLRSGASGSSNLIGCIPFGTRISIDCVKVGTSVTGPYGATNLWDHTTYGGSTGFVADAWVYTGTAAAVAPSCAGDVPTGGGSVSPTGVTKMRPCLNLREDATGESTKLGCVPYNTTIQIDCVKRGTTVSGPYGATNIWDHTTYGGKSGYVADALVYTGTNKAVAGTCGTSQNPPPQGPGIGLPFPVGETWTASGSHSWNGAGNPRSSLDFSGGSGNVTAAGAGTAHFTSCGLLMINHGQGLWTSYYHINVSAGIQEGTAVTYGTKLGTIGTQIPCGGSAARRHVHFTVWRISSGWNGQRVDNSWGIDLEGRDIGGWVEHHAGKQNYWSWFIRVTDGARQESFAGFASLKNDGRLASW